jgi:hypothetical protein
MAVYKMRYLGGVFSFSMVWTPPTKTSEVKRYSGSLTKNKEESSTMKKITTIVIDLAKKVFQVAIYNKHGVMKSNNEPPADDESHSYTSRSTDMHGGLRKRPLFWQNLHGT